MELHLRAFVKSRRDAKRPFFLFGYLWDPHYDYIPPAPYDQEFVGANTETIDVTGYEFTNKVNASISPAQLRYVISQYEGEIAWTDALLGRFLQLLKDDGLWDDTLIIVTSDHGEEFFERGKKGHKNNLFRESVHVPLIVKYPRGGPRGRSSRLVSLVDILPTILDVTGARSSVPHQGRSLRLPEAEQDRAIFFELLAVWYLQKPTEKESQKSEENWFAVRQGDYKLIAVPDEGRFELYNVREDPGERTDLAGREPLRARKLRAALAEWHGRSKAVATNFREGGNAELSPENLERLRALGYLR
jgi:arylsulfatase A-like enzyme